MRFKCTALHPPTNEKGISFLLWLFNLSRIRTSNAGCMYSALSPLFLKESTKSGVDEKIRSTPSRGTPGSRGDEIQEAINPQNCFTSFMKSPKNSCTYSR